MTSAARRLEQLKGAHVTHAPPKKPAANAAKEPVGLEPKWLRIYIYIYKYIYIFCSTCNETSGQVLQNEFKNPAKQVKSAQLSQKEASEVKHQHNLCFTTKACKLTSK